MAVDLARVLRFVAVIERGQGRACLIDRFSRLQPADDTEEAGATHDALARESRQLEWLRRPEFGHWICAKPGTRLVRKHANDGMSQSVENDSATDHVRIAAEASSPEALR